MVTVTIKKKFRKVLVLQRKRAIWGEIAGNNIHLISFWFHSVSTFSKKKKPEIFQELQFV